jgi:type II secretory pathway component PulM
MPEAVPRERRHDDTAADARSLQRLGMLEPQPIPVPVKAPAPDPVDEQEALAITNALADAGIATADSDKAAARALAALDPATVETVTKWLKTKKTAAK